jgi:hypothetical protein
VPPPPRWLGLEANLAWPLVPGVGIYQARGTVTLWRADSLHGDLVLAVNVRPSVLRESEGQFSEFGGGVGYRQFFWRGLHLEVAAYPSLARLEKNVLTGASYEAFALTLEAYGGYRFLLSELGVAAAARWPLEPAITLQGGVGANVFLSNRWPTTVPDAPVFAVGSLLVGAAF